MFFSKLCATEIPIRSWSGPGLLHWHNVHPDKISNASDIATCPSYILYEKKKILLIDTAFRSSGG